MFPVALDVNAAFVPDVELGGTCVGVQYPASEHMQYNEVVVGKLTVYIMLIVPTDVGLLGMGIVQVVVVTLSFETAEKNGATYLGARQRLEARAGASPIAPSEPPDSTTYVERTSQIV